MEIAWLVTDCKFFPQLKKLSFLISTDKAVQYLGAVQVGWIWSAPAVARVKRSECSPGPGCLYSSTYACEKGTNTSGQVLSSNAGLRVANHRGLVLQLVAVSSAGLRFANHQVSTLCITLFGFINWFNGIISFLWTFYTFVRIINIIDTCFN